MESDISTIVVKSQLAYQIQIQETKDIGWIFEKIVSMKISFHKNGKLNGPSYVKNHLSTSVKTNIENNDPYCFI